MPTNGKKMKKVESDNPSAFRKLFDERGQVELSPQFKKIWCDKFYKWMIY